MYEDIVDGGDDVSILMFTILLPAEQRYENLYAMLIE